MTDPTVDKWPVTWAVNDDDLTPTPESDAVAEVWEQVKAGFERMQTPLDGIVTVPPGPLKTPDMDEIRRLYNQVTSARPEWNRVAVAPDVIASLPKADPPRYGHPAWDPFALPIDIDPSLQPGVWELRDGDRPVRRYEPKPSWYSDALNEALRNLGAEQGGSVARVVEQAEELGVAVEFGQPTTETVEGPDGTVTLKVHQPYRFVEQPPGGAKIID